MSHDTDIPVLPTLEQVTYRALCLAAVVGRSRFEEYVAEGKPLDRVQEMDADLRTWLDEEGVLLHLSPHERDLLAKPLGSWERQERIDAGWRVESLGVLLWALSLFAALAPYDREFESEEALEATGLYGFAPAADLLARARLRPAAEIGDAREAAELWHWRAAAAGMQARGVRQPDGRPWKQVIASAAATAHRCGWAPAPVDGDFPLLGRPYSQETEATRHSARSIASERHRALNWLCGDAADWDDVTTDT